MPARSCRQCDKGWQNGWVSAAEMDSSSRHMAVLGPYEDDRAATPSRGRSVRLSDELHDQRGCD